MVYTMVKMVVIPLITTLSIVKVVIKIPPFPSEKHEQQPRVGESNSTKLVGKADRAGRLGSSDG